MVMRRLESMARLRVSVALMLPVMLGACGGGPSATEAPVAVVTALVQPVAPSASSAPLPCEKAEEERARASALRVEGKDDRAVRVLARADRICPSPSGPGALLRMTTLVDLGRGEEALALAATIEGDPAVTAAAREAIATARAKVKADAAAPPDGDALYRAGLDALAAGRRAAAQRLFDRATVAIERAARTTPGMVRATIQLDTPNGITGHLQTLAFARTPERSYLAVAADAEIRLYDTTTWAFHHALVGDKMITSIAVSPDGKTVAAGALDAFRLWDVESGEERWKLPGTYVGAAFSRDGKSLLLVDRFAPRLEVWDAAPGAKRRTIVPAALAVPPSAAAKGAPPQPAAALSIRSYGLSPNGDRVVAGLSDGTARIWSTATGKELRAITTGSTRVISVEIDATGKILLAAGQKVTQLFAIATGKQLHSFPGGFSGNAVFTEDQRSVAISTPTGMTLRDVSTGAEQRVVGGATPQTLAIEPGGTRIAAAELHRIVIWDQASGAEVGRIARIAEPVAGLRWLPGTSTFASGGFDKSVRIWDAARGAPIKTFEADGWVYGLDASADGKTIAAGTTRGATQLWDVSTGAKIEDWKGTGGTVHAVTFDARGTAIVVGSEDGAVTLFDRQTHAQKQQLALNDGSVSSLGVSPDGRWIAVGTQSSTVHLVEEATMIDRASMTMGNMVNTVAFGHDGTSLLVTENDAQIFDTRGAQLTRVRRLSGHSGWLKVATWRGDGEMIATGSSDTTVRLWEPSDGSSLATLRGHQDRVNALAFRPDGKRLISGGEDGTIRIWSVDDERALLVLRPVAGGSDAYAFTPGPDARVELFGDAGRASLLCRIGASTYLFALCAERVEVPGLGAKVLAGDRSYLDP